ncbi:hypothetical protein N7466_002392 [Penicillium verhagenii]|uniref:uncharacterized protein n=1 Tax=Penicillium verhagenii TaxID=1562060 RepID=UPI002545A9C1|nr:uncharacterized protein N7466_002392 [Penicillium verhagenii]KAJ5939258.1 hypothetical protein N7466_002392 [Penicillium verhagenii]
MENLAPPSSSISVDLPFRPTPHLHHEDSNKKELDEPQATVRDTQVKDAADEPSDPTPKPKSGKTNTKFEEASEVIGPQIVAEMHMKKKKKNRHGPKIKRGMGKPTGFEEWHTDGPLTPAEYTEDLGLYDLNRSFKDRIEEALMRFQRKRRIEPARSNVFQKYLQYGGVSFGPNFGTGVTESDMKEMTTEEIMQARTQTLIEKEREGLDISFNEVVAGFLGSFYMGYFNPDSTADIEMATDTIRNFLTFLLFHNVCPEYKDDILQARKTCNIARLELSKSMKLIGHVPGDFNRACSSLFSAGYLSDDTSGIEKAQNTIKYAIAGTLPAEIATLFRQHVRDRDIQVQRIPDIDGFEVISVAKPEIDVLAFYHAFTNGLGLTPVGYVKAKSFRDPGKPETDLSTEERWDWDHGKAPSHEFLFLIEQDQLDLYYPGLKVQTNVWRLNCGAYYFQGIYSTLPSFAANIGNDLMLNWKRPRDLRNEVRKSKESESHNDLFVDDAIKMALKATGQKQDDDKGLENADESDEHYDTADDGE